MYRRHGDKLAILFLACDLAVTAGMWLAAYLLRFMVLPSPKGVPELEVVVFFAAKDGSLTLYDVVGPRVPTFAELHAFLADVPHHEVRFGFVPDQLAVEPTGYVTLLDDSTQVLAPFELPGPRCGRMPDTYLRIVPGYQERILHRIHCIYSPYKPCPGHI